MKTIRGLVLLVAILCTLPLNLMARDRAPDRLRDSLAAYSTPFSVLHTPAAGSQATITQAAAGTGVKNVVEGVCYGYSATTALGGITTVTINLRDGATGAGTILKSWQYTLPAAVLPSYAQCLSGLHIQGTANTATTIEFSASVGNLMEFVSMDGYTLP